MLIDIVPFFIEANRIVVVGLKVAVLALLDIFPINIFSNDKKINN
jgi:hypothetical protein